MNTYTVIGLDRDTLIPWREQYYAESGYKAGELALLILPFYLFSKALNIRPE